MGSFACFNARSTLRKSFGASFFPRRTSTSILGSQRVKPSIFKSLSPRRNSSSYHSRRNSAEPTSPANEEPVIEEPSPEEPAAEPAEEESEEPAYVSEVWPDEDGEYNPPSTASTVDLDLSTLRNPNEVGNSDGEAGAEEGGNRRDRKETPGKSVAFKDFDLEKS